MTIEITDLALLPATDVATQRDLLLTQIQELHPELDLRSGPLHDIVLELYAILQTAQNTNFSRLLDSQSLLAISEDSTLADDDIVDRLLSNYLITRQDGTVATGNITIVVSTLTPLSIGQGAVFFANGVSFVTEATYAARISEDAVTAATDRLLLPLGDGTYSFAIPVVAETVGQAGALRQGARLITDVVIPDLVKVHAAADFTGGTNAETNADLLTKLDAGLAIAAWADRPNIEKLIRKQASFSDVLAISVIGCGDTEMTRDQHGLCPISHGGRTDIYVRTQALYLTPALTIEATFIERDEAGGLWQFSIPADLVPGFYRVVVIRPAAALSGTFAVLSDTRAYDITETDPDIVTAAEGTYSAYQTAVIRFVDTITLVTALTAGDTADYYVELQSLPLLADLQTFANTRETISPNGDVLIKAAIPCFISLGFTLYAKPLAATIDQTAIRNALADYVNNLGFTDRIYAAALQHIIGNYLPGGVFAGRVEVSGRLRPPDAAEQIIRSFDILLIPSAGMVSSRTVCCYLDPAAVTIEVTTTNQ